MNALFGPRNIIAILILIAFAYGDYIAIRYGGSGGISPMLAVWAGISIIGSIVYLCIAVSEDEWVIW